MDSTHDHDNVAELSQAAVEAYDDTMGVIDEHSQRVHDLIRELSPQNHQRELRELDDQIFHLRPKKDAVIKKVEELDNRRQDLEISRGTENSHKIDNEIHELDRAIDQVLSSFIRRTTEERQRIPELFEKEFSRIRGLIQEQNG